MFNEIIFYFSQKTPLFASIDRENFEIVQLLLSRDDLNINKGYIYKLSNIYTIFYFKIQWNFEQKNFIRFLVFYNIYYM